MPLASTAEGKVILVEVSTGSRIERWPVDARDMIACGEYVAADTPNEAHSPAASAALPPDQPPQEHVLGVPLVIMQAHDAPPGQPFSEPVRTKGKQGKK